MWSTTCHRFRCSHASHKVAKRAVPKRTSREVCALELNLRLRRIEIRSKIKTKTKKKKPQSSCEEGGGAST